MPARVIQCWLTQRTSTTPAAWDGTLGWNIWSNVEIWLRGHDADTLLEDEDARKATQNISVDIIRDKELRKAAQVYKDSMLILMRTYQKNGAMTSTPWDT